MPVPVVNILDAVDYDQQVAAAAAQLRAGHVVVLPTETVYGAAGLLNHPEAIAKLKSLRHAPEPRPFTIHLARREDAKQYLGPVSDIGERMMKKLWPGPVGLTFDVPAQRRAEVAAKLGVHEAELYDGDTITLRCPDHMVFEDVVGKVPGPVALTAAGPGGHVRGSDLAAALGGKVDLILDAGESRFNKPSTLLRIRGDRYEVARAGVYDERIIDRMLKTTILFVCSGNTCRSPMAEAIARQILGTKLGVKPEELENKGINVISAGSFAMPGARATPQAVDAVKGIGTDLTRHRSQPLSVELIHQADHIYTMSRNHARAVAALVPSAADKTEPLDPLRDIEDPIGGDQSLYTDVAGQIKTLIEHRVEEGKLP